MMGEPTNDDPDCFWQADVEEAAQRLAVILEAEQADVLTVYDDFGGYGHPDHIQVHRVGMRAGELAGTPKVYMNTVNMDAFRRSMKDLAELDLAMPGDIPPEDFELGVPEERITTTVDVTDKLDIKRAAMAAHASQIAETSFFLAMPPEMFTLAFGQESYMLEGAPRGTAETDLFEGLG
jgi:LmbE family N-acetylglucosaminyl deacetylase